MEKKPGVRREERAGLDSSISDKFLLLPCTGSRASFTRVNASQISGKMMEKDTYYQPVGAHHMIHTLPIIIDIYYLDLHNNTNKRVLLPYPVKEN